MMLRTILALLWASCASAQVPMTGGGLGTPASGPTYLLSQLSTAPTIAYSTRQIASGATNAMQVTRSSDSTTSNIGFSGGNLNTTTLNSFCSATTCYLTTWYDQSGNAINATCSTTLATCPVVVNAGTNNTLNSQVCGVWTLGTATTFSFTHSIPQPASFAILFKNTSASPGSSGHLTDGINGGGRQLFGFNTTTYQTYAGSASASGGTPNTTQTHTGIAIFNGASSVVVLDGTTIISGTNIGTNTANGQLIGSGQNPTAFGGFLCEYIIDLATIGGTDESTIRTSWQSYWGAV
jgi:hypothetical protein